MCVQERRWKFPLGMHEDLSGLLSREGIQVSCSGADAHSIAGVCSRGEPQLLPRIIRSGGTLISGEASLASPLRRCRCLLCFMDPKTAKRTEACCQCTRTTPFAFLTPCAWPPMMRTRFLEQLITPAKSAKFRPLQAALERPSSFFFLRRFMPCYPGKMRRIPCRATGIHNLTRLTRQCKHASLYYTTHFSQSRTTVQS